MANLKGRDRERANILRGSGYFEVPPALITRHKSGAAEDFEEDYYWWHGWNRGYSRHEAQDERHEMIDCYEDSIDFAMWVDTSDKTVNFDKLAFDNKKETLDGKGLFQSNDKIDEEDYSRPRGMAEPHLDEP